MHTNHEALHYAVFTVRLSFTPTYILCTPFSSPSLLCSGFSDHFILQFSQYPVPSVIWRHTRANLRLASCTAFSRSV